MEFQSGSASSHVSMGAELYSGLFGYVAFGSAHPLLELWHSNWSRTRIWLEAAKVPADPSFDAAGR
jgi:hypothetical protein